MARALQSGVACYVLSIKAKPPLMNIAVNFTDFPFCESYLLKLPGHNAIVNVL